MTGGKRIVLLGSTFLMTGCVTDQNYHVRAIADPAVKFRYAGSLIAQGRAQLALGNVGLALETFRKAQREQPPSADTFAGIAACYAAMGRYDIARANYEFALAYAPSDRILLTALAGSLDQLGENAQAAEVRAEALRLAAAPAPAALHAQADQAKQAAVTPMDVPRLSSITVALPSPVSKKPERSTPRTITVAMKKAAPSVGAPQAQTALAERAAVTLIDIPRAPSVAVELTSPAPKKPERSAPRATGAVEKAAPSIGLPPVQAPVIKIPSNRLPPKKVELAAVAKAPTRAAQAAGRRAAPPRANGSSDQIRLSHSDLAADAAPKAPISSELRKPAPAEIVASRPATAVKPATDPLALRPTVLAAASPVPLRPVNAGPAASAASKIPMSIDPPKPAATVIVASRPAAAVKAATVQLAARPTMLEKTAVKPATALAASRSALSAAPLEMAAQPKEQSHAPVPVSQKPPAMPADRPREAIIARAEPGVESGPHLQRLSLHEVALVTEHSVVRPPRPKPQFPEAPLPTPTDVAMSVSRAEPAPHLASADAVSWVPLKYASLQAPVQLLNAARTQSLAARTRVTLVDRGWHKVRIGNALRVRRHSLVLYASARWGVARRLAAYFGCKAVKSDKVRNVVVLLGRDAAMLRRGSSRA